MLPLDGYIDITRKFLQVSCTTSGVVAEHKSTITLFFFVRVLEKILEILEDGVVRSGVLSSCRLCRNVVALVVLFEGCIPTIPLPGTL